MNLNYLNIISNSHFWTNLNQIIDLIEEQPEILTPEYLKIGLFNSKKNGYELKLVNKSNNSNVNWVFQNKISINEIVDFIDSKEFNLFKLYNLLINYRDAGFNLTNGKRAEKWEIYKSIDEEIEYQNANWKIKEKNENIFNEEISLSEWIIYVEHHLNKTKNFIYQHNTNKVMHELRKIAALLIRTMEIYGCPKRIMLNANDENKIDSD